MNPWYGQYGRGLYGQGYRYPGSPYNGYGGYPGIGGYPGTYGYPGASGYPGTYGYPGVSGYPGLGGYGNSLGYPSYNGFNANSQGLAGGISMPGIGSLNAGQMASNLGAASMV